MIDNNIFRIQQPLNTAVLLLIFNRLDTTKQVFAAIKKAKPPRLYIAADGARKTKEGEEQKVKLIRDYIISNIDWKCEVKTLFQEQNLGCKMAVSGAIDWFFKNEEMGIILEDDCLPSQSFFWFCQSLLNKYKTNKEVGLISGDCRMTNNLPLEDDYTFIKYSLIWGWATWRRVWQEYDVEIKDWPNEKKDFLNRISDLKETKRYWRNTLNSVYDNKLDTWDYQFSYLNFKQNRKCLIPNVNLIKNIGFGEDATHTININSEDANIKNHEINFPLRHPENTKMNEEINFFYDKNVFHSKDTIPKRIIKKILRELNINYTI
jgi:hypothetical protein